MWARILGAQMYMSLQCSGLGALPFGESHALILLRYVAGLNY
jgi:hypothetical protein